MYTRAPKEGLLGSPFLKAVVMSREHSNMTKQQENKGGKRNDVRSAEAGVLLQLVIHDLCTAYNTINLL